MHGLSYFMNSIATNLALRPRKCFRSREKLSITMKFDVTKLRECPVQSTGKRSDGRWSKNYAMIPSREIVR